MSNKIVVSNVRFPQDEWMQLKIAASSLGMSTNEYLRYLSQTESVKIITGTKNASTKPSGYAAMEVFLNRVIDREPKDLSHDDEVVYGEK